MKLPPEETVSMAPLERMVPITVPAETTSLPPESRVALRAVPPADTMSVPPLLTVVPLAKPWLEITS
ncbi:hypothetical protein Acid7E03_14400 [Acidisoma sp. 7E03]